MRDNCDKCNGPIKDGECSCGIWYDNGDDLPLVLKLIKQSTSEFEKLHVNLLGFDDVPSGTAGVFFRGDFEMCEKVKDYVKKLQNNEEK